MDGFDDLAGVDALQVDGGHAEVLVAELALDDVQRHALARELDRVRVPELVRREAPPYAGPGRAEVERFAGGAGGPRAPAGTAVQHAEQRADRHLLAGLQPGLDVLEAPDVHADLAPASALAATHQDRAAARVEVELGQRQRFLDAQPGAPQDHDQRAHSVAVEVSPAWRMTATISSVRGGSAG